MNPSDRSDEDYERLARLLSGEAGDAERAATELWVAAEPEREALMVQMVEDWRVSGVEAGDVEAGLARLKGRIAREREKPVIPIRTTKTAPWWRVNGPMLRAAAFGVIVLGAGLLWVQRGSNEAPASLAASSAVRLSTAIGERRVIDLVDGSQITLGPSSSAVTRVGEAGPREVELVGEAFFRVTHDETRPFVVTTGQGVIEDLGTEFTVRAIGGETPLQVAVSEGSVSVRRDKTSARDEVVLQPRDMLTLPDTGEAVVARNVDIEPFQAWTTGRLVFRNATFADAIVELERWYRADFRIGDQELLRKHLDVEFSGQSLDEVLSVIGRILDVRLVRRGDAVEVAAPERTSLGISNPAEIGGGG